MPKRRLVLSREALVPLESDELSSVAGGISNTQPCLITLNQAGCPTYGIACTHECPTRQCPTDHC